MASSWKPCWRALGALALLPMLGGAPGTALSAERGLQGRAAPMAAAAEDTVNARVIVKYRSGSALANAAAGRPQQAGTLGRHLGLNLSDGHVLGKQMQSVRATGMSSRALAQRLATHADVEWAQAVGRKAIRGVLPNDPYFADNQTTITPTVGQWYLRAPDATMVSAINAVGAWGVSTGSASITVAVVDTGVRFDHPDLAGKLWPGYDFVSRTGNSNDSTGVDSDASDPGDWSVASDSCGASNSSWHGTQVAGLIGAASDNNIGMASIGRNVMVLPVRVLGKCGGYDDDIIAGMRWAAGLSRSPVVNPHPAQVINLSLGSTGACSAGYSQAIAEITAAGVAVVVAAGNDAGLAVAEPANCPGAIAVAGVRHAGSKVGYSNLGPQVAIAAPAGNCVNVGTGEPCLYPLLTTDNTGTKAPSTNTYSDSYNSSLGTSFASPIVAGTVGLMLSVDPSLTPARVKTLLQSTARVFPVTGSSDTTVVACKAPSAAEQLECYCTTTTCGAGLLDAGKVVTQVQAALAVLPTAAFTVSNASPTAGASVTLDAGGSSAITGRSIASYQWQITTGGSLASFTGAIDGKVASLATSAAGSVVVTLTVTDNQGSSRSTSQSLTVAAAPVVTPPAASGGSGGGAMGWPWLAGLALAVLALAVTRRSAS